MQPKRRARSRDAELATRVNVSISPEILDRGHDVMHARAISKFSHLVATLIREEFDRRGLALRNGAGATLPPR